MAFATLPDQWQTDVRILYKYVETPDWQAYEGMDGTLHERRLKRVVGGMDKLLAWRFGILGHNASTRNQATSEVLRRYDRQPGAQLTTVTRQDVYIGGQPAWSMDLPSTSGQRDFALAISEYASAYGGVTNEYAIYRVSEKGTTWAASPGQALAWLLTTAVP